MAESTEAGIEREPGGEPASPRAILGAKRGRYRVDGEPAGIPMRAHDLERDRAVRLEAIAAGAELPASAIPAATDGVLCDLVVADDGWLFAVRAEPERGGPATEGADEPRAALRLVAETAATLARARWSAVATDGGLCSEAEAIRALGAALYELLAGARPDRTRLGVLVPPSRLAPGRFVPRGAELVALRALAPNADHGYRDLGAFSAAAWHALAPWRRLLRDLLAAVLVLAVAFGIMLALGCSAAPP